MAAVDRLVDELQAGWDRHDADVTDRSLAADVLWGSPYGATIEAASDLHEIHVRLEAQGVGGPVSRFEVVTVRVPTPGVAVAQVRRVALDADDDRSFSELALYVLVRSDGASAS